MSPHATLKTREPETQALMLLLQQRRFHLAANMHGGALVVNYPWDGQQRNGMPDAPPDVAVFRCAAVGIRPSRLTGPRTQSTGHRVLQAASFHDLAVRPLRRSAL